MSNSNETNLRKLWDVELDLLEKFKEICSKHGLKYYAIGGTLLGAVRHKGFIPWDDDIDLLMPFDDYLAFLHLAQNELDYPYFLSSFLSEPKTGGILGSKLRRSDTTGCTKWEIDNIGIVNCEEEKHNMGIWIDIFPLCNVPDNTNERIKQKEQIMEAWKAVRGYNALQCKKANKQTSNSEYDQYIANFELLNSLLNIGEIKSLYIQRCGMIREKTEMVGLLSWRTLDPRFIWKYEWFIETIEVPYDNTTIVIPQQYDQILSTQYGDWKTPVENGASHEMFIYDTEMSYTEKLAMLFESN